MNLCAYASAVVERHVARTPLDDAHAAYTVDSVLLLVDMVGSTYLSERFSCAGPIGIEQLHRLLNRYFGKLFDTVRRHGGDVVHIEGDATLVIWTLEAHGEAAAGRAARAALELRGLFRHWRPLAEVSFKHRLCLAAGPVQAIECRTTQQRRFVVMAGEPVHAATQLIATAEPDQIIATSAFLDRLPQVLRQSLDQGSDELLVPLTEKLPPAHGLTALAATLRPYVSHVVAEYLDSGEVGWLSEFRTVTMAYVRVDAGEAGSMMPATRMQGAVTCIQNAIGPVGVTISDIVAGDKGLVVVVAGGLPFLAQEVSAVRVMEAALRIDDALRALGMRASTGISTGVAFCGDVGSPTRRVYLVNGPVMYVAARLMQSARHAILVDADTLRHAHGRFELSPMPPLAAKGLREPLAVHRILAARDGKPLPRLLPLRGREETIALLKDLLRPQAATRRLIVIEGEPGAGKSHLLGVAQEFGVGLGRMCLRMAASPFESAQSYAAVRGLVCELLRRPDGTPPLTRDDRREALSHALAGSELHDRRALMEDVMSFGLKASEALDGITGDARFSFIEDIVIHLCERFCMAMPALICVDDLHWVDDASARLIAALVGRVNQLVIVAATRPLTACNGSHVLALRDAAYVAIPLPRLDTTSVRAIICDTLGADTAPAVLFDFVEKRAHGLPLHVQQLAVHLQERGVVALRARQCYLCMNDLSGIDTPGTLRELIISRVDQLDATQQSLAKRLSVAHGEFSAELLDVLQPDRPKGVDTAAGLRALVEARILEVRDGVCPRYTFRHALLREVVYALVPFDQRGGLHDRMARHIEAKHADALDAVSAELAEHWERAAVPAKAMHYRRSAAQGAIARFANHDALVHVEAYRRLTNEAGIALTDEDRSRLACLQGDACHELSMFSEANAWLRQCARLEGIGLPRNGLSMACDIAGQAARQLLHRCGWLPGSRAAGRLHREVLAAHIFTRLAEHAYFNGDTLGMLHANLRALNAAQRSGAIRENVASQGAMAIGLGVAGMHRAADHYGQQAVALASRSGTRHDLSVAHLFSAVCVFHAGRWDEVETHCRIAAALCEKTGDRFRHQTCLILQAHVALIRGRHDDAEALFSCFGPAGGDVDNVPVRAWLLAGWAMLDLLRGGSTATALKRLSAAQSQPLQRAEQVMCAGVEAMAHWLAGDERQAMEVADRALGLMAEGVPTMGIALLSLGALTDVHLVLGEGASRVGSLVKAYAKRASVFQPLALFVKGQMLRERGRAGRAQDCLQRSLRLATDLDMPLERARCHQVLAMLERDAGQRASHAAAAAALINEFRLQPWFDALRRGPRDRTMTTSPCNSPDDQAVQPREAEKWERQIKR